jgi:hypothetical protein
MYEIVVINKTDYPIRFGMNSLRLFCKDTGRTLQDLDKLGQDMSLDDACYLILNGIKDGCRVSGKECSLGEQFSAKFSEEDKVGNVKAPKGAKAKK